MIREVSELGAGNWPKADKAYNRWHAAGHPSSEKAQSWKSGYVSALVDGSSQRADRLAEQLLFAQGDLKAVKEQLERTRFWMRHKDLCALSMHDDHDNYECDCGLTDFLDSLAGDKDA